jgi:peptide/nickel transport system substrate-binding protein
MLAFQEIVIECIPMNVSLDRPWGLFLALVVTTVGCSSETTRPTDAGSGETAASEAPTTADSADAPAEFTKPFVLGDLVEPFDPPPLDELDKSAEWQDRPVLDGMAVLRKEQETEQDKPLPVEEALALRNTSDVENEQILNSLGRVPPPDDQGVDFEQSWVRHVAGDLKSSNPLVRSSVTEAEFHTMTGFNGTGLLSYDRDLNYFASADTITSWQTSKDHKLNKFVLRDDITWSDGKPITAYDIEFSFKAIMSSAVPILALRQGVDQFRWVQAYDDRTVVIFHKDAFATNDDALSNFSIVPKHIYENSIAEDPTLARSEYHTRLEDHPVVGGPYELTKRVRNQEFVVSRRESYYMHNGKQVRPKPYFKEIRTKAIEDYNTALLALKAGHIEEMYLRPEHWYTQANDDDFYRLNTKVHAVDWSEFHFVWNQKTPYFSDKRVREAMSWAYDYDELLTTICRGLYQPAQGPFHPTNWAFPKDPPQPYHQDLDKAEDLLDEAGWTDSDGDGIRDKEIDGRLVPFEFTLITYQTETGLQASILLKESLEKIGVVCNVKPTEFTVLVESTQNRTFEAAMGGWSSGTDPDTSANIYASGESRNFAGYSNPRVDELYEQGRREFDHAKRAGIYAEIHNILWEDQPYTWLFYRNSFYAFSKKLRGYNFSPTGPYYFDPGMMSLHKTAVP